MSGAGEACGCSVGFKGFTVGGVGSRPQHPGQVRGSPEGPRPDTRRGHRGRWRGQGVREVSLGVGRRSSNLPARADGCGNTRLGSPEPESWSLLKRLGTGAVWGPASRGRGQEEKPVKVAPKEVRAREPAGHCRPSYSGLATGLRAQRQRGEAVIEDSGTEPCVSHPS